MLFLMMGKRQSLMQCIGLLGLFGASCILSGGQASSGGSAGEKSLAFYEGVVPCLVASLLSGLASALSQIALQVNLLGVLSIVLWIASRFKNCEEIDSRIQYHILKHYACL